MACGQPRNRFGVSCPHPIVPTPGIRPSQFADKIKMKIVARNQRFDQLRANDALQKAVQTFNQPFQEILSPAGNTLHVPRRDSGRRTVGRSPVGNSTWIIFAVAVTLVVVMRKLSVPADSILGRLPGSQHFVDAERNREAEQIPGLLIFRPNGILFFANASRVHKHLRELMKRTSPRLRAVVLDLESRPETDVTSLEMLDQLKNELYDAGVVSCASG